MIQLIIFKVLPFNPPNYFNQSYMKSKSKGLIFNNFLNSEELLRFLFFLLDL